MQYCFVVVSVMVVGRCVVEQVGMQFDLQDVGNCIIDVCYWDFVVFYLGDGVGDESFLVIGYYYYIDVGIDCLCIVVVVVVGYLGDVVLVGYYEVVEVYFVFQCIGQQCFVVVYFVVIYVGGVVVLVVE